MKFYCVNVQFFDYGKVLACITDGERKKKPNNQFRQVYGMSAFKIWLVDEAVARQLYAEIKSGEFGIEDVLSFYSDPNEHDSQQKKAA